MREIRIEIDKAEVWDEAAKIAAYTGAKYPGSESPGQTTADAEGAYDRIMLTDEDAETLERFWEESCSHLKELVKEQGTGSPTPALPQEGGGEGQGDADEGKLTLALRVTDNWKPELEGSVRTELRGFLILRIVSEWFRLSNKGEAESYLAEARERAETGLRMLAARRRPERP